MLKITRIDTPIEQKLILEGRLTQPWIADLGSHWEETRQAHPERKFLVDLRGVTRVDRFGESALALMKSEGAEFLARGIRIRHVLKGLEQRRRKKLTVAPAHSAVLGVLPGQQIEGPQTRDGETGGYHRGNHVVQVLPKNPEIQKQVSEATKHDLPIRPGGVPDRVLHPGIGSDDKESRQPGSNKLE